jgi:hypothetical protein
MTQVTLIHDAADPETMPYRAVAGKIQAMGRTAGEAIDALTARMEPENAQTLVIVRNLSGDRYFTDEQRQRMERLISQHKRSLEGHAAWTRDDEAELIRLVDAELKAATERAEALCRELGR